MSFFFFRLWSDHLNIIVCRRGQQLPCSSTQALQRKTKQDKNINGRLRYYFCTLFKHVLCSVLDRLKRSIVNVNVDHNNVTIHFLSISCVCLISAFTAAHGTKSISSFLWQLLQQQQKTSTTKSCARWTKTKVTALLLLKWQFYVKMPNGKNLTKRLIEKEKWKVEGKTAQHKSFWCWRHLAWSMDQ